MKTRLILACSIAAILSLAVQANSIITAPTVAFADDDALNPADVQDFAAKDENRLVGSVIQAVTQRSPYIGVLTGGTMPSGVSQVQRSVVSERAVLNASLVRPEFINTKDACGTRGKSAKVGSTEFDYEPQVFRGMGPLVCVRGGWAAFTGSYAAGETALRDQLVQLNNADIRINITDRGGCKLTVKTDQTFEAMFDGTINAIDTAFPAAIGVPNAAPSLKLLQYACRYMREDLGVTPFEGDQNNPEATMRLIGSMEIIDLLREEAGIREDHRYMAAGQMKVGSKLLSNYRWEGPYRGMAFGVDPKPLRFNELDEDGNPIYIEPEIEVETTNGSASRPNPLWVRAKYEVLNIMGSGSFKKLAPEQWTGEGTTKFPALNTTGTLKWKIIEDNDANAWGDFGRHFYQFERAYRPERPHHVLSVAYARGTTDFDLTEVTDFGNFSSTASV